MKTSSPEIIEITDLVLTPPNTLRRLSTSRFILHPGEVCTVISDFPADGRHLLRVLATLDQPDRGNYRFKGKPVDLSNYQTCLSVKRKIGYVAPDAAMISNRTLWENLLLSRFYHEDDLSIDIDETMDALCRQTRLSAKLNQRPSSLSADEFVKALAIREMGKNPVVLLLDCPENFIEPTEDDIFYTNLRRLIQLGTAVVYFSHKKNMAELANRQIYIGDGEITMRSI